MARQFYYQVMGEVIGPVSGHELRQKAMEGVVTPDTSVRVGADGEWVSASRLKNLFDAQGRPISQNRMSSSSQGQESDTREPGTRSAREGNRARVSGVEPPPRAQTPGRVPITPTSARPISNTSGKKKTLWIVLAGFCGCLVMGAVVVAIQNRTANHETESDKQYNPSVVEDTAKNLPVHTKPEPETVDPIQDEREMLKQAIEQLQELGQACLLEGKRLTQDREFTRTAIDSNGRPYSFRMKFELGDEVKVDVFRSDSVISPLRGEIEVQAQSVLTYMDGLGKINKPTGWQTIKVEYYYQDGEWHSKSGSLFELIQKQ